MAALGIAVNIALFYEFEGGDKNGFHVFTGLRRIFKERISNPFFTLTPLEMLEYERSTTITNKDSPTSAS